MKGLYIVYYRTRRGAQNRFNTARIELVRELLQKCCKQRLEARAVYRDEDGIEQVVGGAMCTDLNATSKRRWTWWSE